jgi:hypothetical protein
MTNVSKTPEKRRIRKQLIRAALDSLGRQGYIVEKVRGGGTGRLRRISKNGKARLAAIRTTQDTWLAFPRNDDDTGWVTLSDVDVVVVASVDDPLNPKFAKVHLLEGKEMRDRFDRAYAARCAAGHTIPLGRGVWLALYDDEATTPVQRVGAGAGNVHPPVAEVPLEGGDEPEIGAVVTTTRQPNGTSDADEHPLTIAEAKTRLARTLGVDPSSIKITVEA